MSGGAQRRAHRALRSAALRLAEAQWNRTDAIVAAHQAGVSMPEIGRLVGLDAFGVRDELVRAGELGALRPKETVAATPTKDRGEAGVRGRGAAGRPGA